MDKVAFLDFPRLFNYCVIIVKYYTFVYNFKQVIQQ